MQAQSGETKAGFSDHSYAESPLGVALGNILRTVKQIRQKYADVDESSVSRAHADYLLSFAQWALEVAHENVLLEFDKGNLKPSCPNVFSLGIWALKVKSNMYLFSTREFTLYNNAIELVKEELPAIIKKNRKKQGALSKQELICSLLEANKKSLYDEAEKLPGVCLDHFFSELLKAIREKNLFAAGFGVDIDQSKKKVALDIAEALRDDISAIEHHLFGPGAQFEDGCFSFAHFHPLFFEVVVEIVKFTYSLPRQLKNLVPFLNPASIDHYAKTVPLVSALSTFGVISHYHFKHTGPSDFKGPHDVVHQYELLVEGPKEKEESPPLWDIKETVNASLEYTSYFDFIYSILLTRLVNYQKIAPENKVVQNAMKSLLKTVQGHYQKNTTSDDFKSEQARASLLKRHVSLGLKNIESILDDIPAPGGSFQELSGIGLIVALDKEIQREQKKAEKHSRLLQLRYELYSRSFRSEISFDKELIAQLSVDRSNGCDVSYADSPMPDYMFDLDDQKTVQLIPIRSALRQALDEKIYELNYDKNSEVELTALRDNATSEWVSARIRQCAIATKAVQDEIELKHKSVVSLNAQRKRNETDSTDIRSLESTLAALYQEEQELMAVKAFAESISEKRREFLIVPNRALIFPLLVDTLERTADTLVGPTKKLLDLTDSALSSLRNERKDLEEDLAMAREKAEEKARAEAEYAKNMAALNIATLERRLREECEQSEALSLCKDQLTQEREQTVSQLRAIACKDLSFLSDESLNFKAQLDHLESSTRTLVVEALEKLPQEETLPDLESSVKNPQIVVQLLQAFLKTLDLRCKTAHPLEKALSILLEVKTILSYNDSQIDIAAIEGLPAIVKKAKGLMGLISMLSFKEDQISEWQQYCADEAETFTIVRKTRRKERRDQLLAQLEAKISDLDGAIRSESEVDSALGKRCKSLVEQLQDNTGKITLLKLQWALKKEDLELAKIENEATHLKASLKALHPCVNLLGDIEKLRVIIEAFSNNEAKFSSQLVQQGLLASLYSEVISINNSLASLKKKMLSFVSLVKSEEYQKAYQVVAMNLQNLLESIGRKFNDSIKDKFSSIESEVRAHKRSIDEFKRKSDQFSEDKDLYDEAVGLLSEQIRLSRILSELRCVIQPNCDTGNYEKILGDLEGALQNVPGEIQSDIDEKFSTTVTALNRSVQQIQDQYEQVNALYTRPIFEGDSFTPEIVQEINEKLELSKQSLLLIERRYHLVRHLYRNVLILKDQKKSDQIFGVMNQLNTLNRNFKGLQRGVVGAKMLSDLSLKFGQYRQYRPNLDSARVEYISEFQQLLLAAAKNRKCEPVIRKLKEVAKAYPGTGFGQLLNQMIVEILDYTRCGHYPNNEPIPLHDDALIRVQKIGDHQAKKTFAKIYANLAQIQNFARKELRGELSVVVDQLAIKLRMDVDRFILKHEPGAEISSQDYKRFKDTFNARLHTQDLIIKQYQPLWAIVASLFVMVLSLGAQPLYSLYHGSSVLYFENKVEVRKQMAVMEKVVSKEHKFLPQLNRPQTR